MAIDATKEVVFQSRGMKFDTVHLMKTRCSHVNFSSASRAIEPQRPGDSASEGLQKNTVKAIRHQSLIRPGPELFFERPKYTLKREYIHHHT